MSLCSTIYSKIKKSYPIRKFAFFLKYKLPVIILGDERIEIIHFKKILGYEPNLKKPFTLNEKMCWLKLHDHRKICTYVVDKYNVRKYFEEKFGSKYVVPLVNKLDSWKDVKKTMIPDYPVIIKCNNGSGTWQIIRDRDSVDYKELRQNCRKWMNFNHYYETQEWQYKNVKPCIIIEKLLLNNDGKLPEDIKLHYFNGKCELIYKVIDREGDNYRAFFTPEWELLPFQFTSKRKYKPINKEIKEPKPCLLDKMIEFGNEIAKHFNYVRVDFYDMGETFYFSEITLYHGAGHNRFYPEEFEQKYADSLKINLNLEDNL